MRDLALDFMRKGASVVSNACGSVPGLTFRSEGGVSTQQRIQRSAFTRLKAWDQCFYFRSCCSASTSYGRDRWHSMYTVMAIADQAWIMRQYVVRQCTSCHTMHLCQHQINFCRIFVVQDQVCRGPAHQTLSVARCDLLTGCPNSG
eukprot:jgi/Ulvmu1/3052/UM015_0092.1